MRYPNPQLITKCEQILCETSCNVTTEQQSSTIRNNKFICTQGEKFSGNCDSEGESFCIEYNVAAFKAGIWKIWVFVRFCNAHSGLDVFNKNLKVYIYT